MSTATVSVTTRWRTVGVVVFCAAGFLLISMGGAIIAAPLTVPLMFVVARRHPTKSFRAIGAALVGATAAEVAWAVTYLAADEAKPWIWLVPLAAALAVIVAVVIVSDPREHSF
jgi:O-antigen/teichoic acid export membrane protein